MKLSKVYGSGFKLKEFSGRQQIAAGASGDILTITPAAGKKVKLTGLASLTTESGISVYRGATKVINNKSLRNSSSEALNSFVIGYGLNAGTQTLDEIQGEINESIRVVKETGVTGDAVNFSFAEGE